MLRKLLRLDKPIGIWLLFFPSAWAVGLAAPSQTLWPLLGAMLVGAALTRSAGCVLNDLTDRTLDAQVARTRTRPLAAGTIRPRTAWGILALLLLGALMLALCLPPAVFGWALVALPLIAAYPWMKRVTGWPQVFLGLTFNLGVPMGWAATGQPLSDTTLLLYLAACCWTVGYDTVYAVQDMQDDARVGIRSSARSIGTRLKRFVGGCYGVMTGLLMLVGLLHQCGIFYYTGVILVAGHLHGQWRHLPPTPQAAGSIFNSNQWVGVFLLVAILLNRVAYP